MLRYSENLKRKKVKTSFGGKDREIAMSRSDTQMSFGPRNKNEADEEEGR